MSYVTRAAKVLANAFLFFVEEGETSENGGTSITVSADAKPDNTPPENWDQRPCTLAFDIEHEFEDDKIKCPSPTGGWQSENDRVRIGSRLVFTEKVWTEHYERLLWALPSPVAANVAQVPFSNSKPEIYGWMKIQQQNVAGANQVICDVWGKLTLTGGTKIEGKANRPEYVFEIISSPLNSWVSEV